MSMMQLGSYTFVKNPTTCTPIEADRITSNVVTFSNAAFLSWGTAIIGKEIEMHWNGMSIAQYNSIKALELADAAITLTPNDGSGKTYSVQIKSFTGAYHMTVNAVNRIDCKLILVVMSVN